MKEKVYGYARVSTKEQNVDRQVIALLGFDVPPEDIMIEKKSGKDFDRPVYKEIIEKLNPGDVLVIKSLDRLGRNYEEIIEQWRYINKEICADIVVLDMPLLDTRGKDRDLIAALVTDLVLQILSYVAQTEREFSLQRQHEGIAAAKQRGVQFGRKPITLPNSLQDVLKSHIDGKISARNAADILGVSRPTFLKWRQANLLQKFC